MGLRSWWADQKQGMREVSERRAADRTRTVPPLEPVIQAELARGNVTTDDWHQTSFGGPNGVLFERHLRFPMDVDALQAQFEFDLDVWLKDNRAGSVEYEAVLHGGTELMSAEQHDARERWWAQWRADPRQRRRLSEEAK